MEKRYSYKVSLRPASGRSARRRGIVTGAATGGGNGVLPDTDGSTGNITAGHEHANKPVLDVLDIDSDGYICQAKGEGGTRLNAGIAERAADFTEDSPARKRYLHRDAADSAEAPIDFTKGLSVTDKASISEDGDGIFHSVSTQSFAPGEFGSGAGMWIDEDGRSHLEADIVTVRQEMRVTALTIGEAKSIGGVLVVSQASGEIRDIVHTQDHMYGLMTDSYAQFRAGDLVRCSQWDALSQSVKHYWVEVDRIDAMMQCVCIGMTRFSSQFPEKGDTIVLMGSTRDKSRQGFIVISSEGGLENVSVYAGVNSPSLQGRMAARFGALDGISDEALGKLSGYGLMAVNAYLSGEFRVKDRYDNIRSILDVTQERISMQLRAVTGYDVNPNLVAGTDTPAIFSPQGGENECPVTPWCITGIRSGDTVTAQMHLEFDGCTNVDGAAFNSCMIRILDRDKGLYGSFMGFWEEPVQALTSSMDFIQTFNVPYYPDGSAVSSDSVLEIDFRLDNISGGTVTVSGVKVEHGDKVTEWTPRTSLHTAIRQTGIDIDNGRIVLSADNTVFQNSSGVMTAGLDADGNLSANSLLCPFGQETVGATIPADIGDTLIPVDPELPTTPTTRGLWRATVNHNDDGFFNSYYPNGNIRASYGWDDITESLLRYYGEDGVMLWKLDKDFIKRASQQDVEFTPVQYYLCKATTEEAARKEIMATGKLSGTTCYLYSSGGEKVLYRAASTKSGKVSGYITQSGLPLTELGQATLPSRPGHIISPGGGTQTHTRTLYMYTDGKAVNSGQVRWQTTNQFAPSYGQET